MMATDLSRAALMIGAALVIAADGPAVAVYAIVIATNVIGITFRPAQAALLPLLAQNPAELAAANVAASTLDAVSTFVGPAIGGVVLAFSSVETVFADQRPLVPVVGRRASRPPRRPAPDPARARPQGPGGFASELTEGLRAVVSDRNVATVSALYAGQAFVAGAMNVLVVVVALRLVDAGAGGRGLAQCGARARRLRRRIRRTRARHEEPPRRRFRARRRPVRGSVRPDRHLRQLSGGTRRVRDRRRRQLGRGHRSVDAVPAYRRRSPARPRARCARRNPVRSDRDRRPARTARDRGARRPRVAARRGAPSPGAHAARQPPPGCDRQDQCRRRRTSSSCVASRCSALLPEPVLEFLADDRRRR